MMLPLKDTPTGSDDVATDQLETAEPVRLYENDCPTVPEAVRDDEITGSVHWAGATVRVRFLLSVPHTFEANM